MECSHVCKFCTTGKGKYKCPRCNVLYCSILCYQSEDHAECSEQFYKECIQDELKLSSISPKDEKQMQEILKKIQNDSFGDVKYETTGEDSDDEIILSDLSERLQNVNFDDVDAIWPCLSDKEKQEFQTIFESGDISKFVDCYEPWWSKRYENKVEDLYVANNKSMEYIKKCPQIGEIVPFNSLCKTTPAPCVIWNISNVLAAYSLISRCYLGDHYNSYAVNHLLKVCNNLNLNSNFDDMASAVESVKHEAMKNGDLINGETSLVLVNDVSKIMLGPEKCAPSFYILAALSDLHAMFVQCLNEKGVVSTEPRSLKNQASVVKLPRFKLKQIANKLDFYMSWINDFYKSVPI